MVICTIVVSVILSMIVGAVSVLGGGGMMGAMGRGQSSAVTFDKDSPAGQLEGFGKKMEEVNRKMEAAQKSGDPGKQAAAAMEGLGAVLGGGKRYEPVALDLLKPLLPESVAGLPRKGQSAARCGVPGLEMPQAHPASRVFDRIFRLRYPAGCSVERFRSPVSSCCSTCGGTLARQAWSVRLGHDRLHPIQSSRQ